MPTIYQGSEVITMPNHFRPRYLGIMICETNGLPPFQEKDYFSRLCTLGARLGIEVYIFSPHRLDWGKQQVRGYTYSPGARQWEESTFPFPDAIYDRSFYNKKSDLLQHRSSIMRLKTEGRIQFLGHGLQGKWSVLQILMRCSELQRYLPHTEVYNGTKQLFRWMKHNGEVFLKPISGSHGRGALYVKRSGDSRFEIIGRDFRNAPLRKEFNRPIDLFVWISSFIGVKKYLLQQYLELRSDNGQVFDVRSLVQKNGSGEWIVTGMAVRLGNPGSITANLHGGGKAEEMNPFLERHFGEVRSREIIAKLIELSTVIPPYLERHFGGLLELGIDFGIDRSGQIWILETNSKPGRSVFNRLKDKNAGRKSVQYPIQYARYILDRQLGG
jgi:glutathione synthase/RimK-type ligase-like ATP-grasp enzyme